MSVRRAPIQALLLGSFVSLVGNGVAALAIPWYVLQRTGSAEAAGLIAAVAVLPTVLAGALGGALVDRVGHRRASILADLASAISMAAIPALDLTLGAAIPTIAALVFLGAIFDVPGVAARQSLMPDLAQLGGVPLERANGTYAAMQRAAQLGGPLLAGLVIAMADPRAALWLNAASFLVSAAAVGFFVPNLKAPAPPRKRYLDDLREGLILLRSDELIRTILTIVALSNFLASPVLAVVLPAYGVRVLEDPLALGVLLAAFAGGAFAGAALFGWRGRDLPRRPLFIASFLLSGAPFALLGFTTSTLEAGIVLFVIGLAAGPINPLLVTVLQERTPPEMRGRVFGAVVAIAWTAMPLGMALSGIAVERVGSRATLQIIGIAFVVLVAIGSWHRGLRLLEARPRPSSP